MATLSDQTIPDRWVENASYTRSKAPEWQPGHSCQIAAKQQITAGSKDMLGI